MAFRRKGVGSSCRQQSIKVGEFRKLAAIRLPFNCHLTANDGGEGERERDIAEPYGGRIG